MIKNKKVSLKILIAVLSLAVLVGFGVYKFQTRQDAKFTPTSGQSQTSFQPATNEEKKQVQDNKVPATPSTPAPTKPSPVPAPSAVEAVILSAAQDSDKNLVIKTQLNGLYWQSCSLAITNGGKVITKATGTLYQSDFSTCTGYVIQASELAAGDTSLILTAKRSDGSTSVSAPKEIKVVK